MKGVDPPTARRLAEAAETLGYQAKVYDDRPLTPVESAARFFWVPIPFIWVSFGLLNDVSQVAQLLLPICILLTILLSTVVPTLFMRRKADDGLALAFGRDLSPHVETALLPAAVASPAPKLSEAEPVPEEPGVVARARRSLEVLSTAVSTAELPALARQDLEATVAQLRAQAAELSSQVRSLNAALDSEPEPTDVSWVHQRLVRLQTLEAAGHAADPQERERLNRTLQEHGAQDDARDALDARRAAAMAQLLEIAATAERSRRELLLVESHTATTGNLVIERLQREVDAVARARQELAARQASRQRG